ncbi:PstS family phosphate ABC transporter substrate-binding protein [Nocardioides plantarum]|uniref:PstS family phosphate ABC transporter substrate-binding protein n=1 Tax=Nocardioides plantarum TaxID=29299 RepID=A0ABV5K7Z0_9ACTN|nr:substrate-binding domain-containing protein [Nocardioides plantarum]
MTRSHHARGRLAVSAALSLALALGVAGCGSDSTDRTDAGSSGVPSLNRAGLEPSDETTDGAGTTADDATDDTVGVRLGDRADPVPGVVEVDGGLDSLTGPARRGFAGTGSGTTVEQQTSGETRGFQRLCIGEVDIVDSARPLTADEYEQCRRNGLDVMQFQVAADAVVLAIKAQTDVGTDCLSTDQIRAGFRNGSAIDNWSQLGSNLDDVEFRAGGPTVEFAPARFFGRYVLGDPEPINSDFRVGYQDTDSEDQTRKFVTGTTQDDLQANLLRTIEPQYVELRRQVAESQGYYDKAQAEVLESVKQQKRGVADKRSPADRAKDDARVTTAYAARGRMIRKLNARKAALVPVARRFKVADAARDRLDDTLGHVGLFSHGYYTTYENELRPFEIEISDGDDQPNCIFPSPQTILNGQYPLSRQLLLTVSTRSLGRPEVQKFLTYYLKRSQSLADKAGVVPLPDANVAQQVAWLQGKEKAPEFGVVDGRFRQLTEEDAQEATQAHPAAPAENPAR